MCIYYNGKHQSSPRGRITAKDKGVIDNIIMMRGMSDVNGKNIEFLGNTINELIDVVNRQNKEILKLKI